MIRISNIRLEIQDDENSLAYILSKKYGLRGDFSYEIVKKSIDARRKKDIHYIYAVDIKTKNEKKILDKYKNAAPCEHREYEFPKGEERSKPIVVVGMGPAGLMCALTLVQNGYKVILLERGKQVWERRDDVDRFWKTGALDVSSNVQFGEGGAGTFSDGKLTTGIKDFRIRKVLEEFYRHGAPKEILYYSKPHIGTDNLCHMVSSVREDIINKGGDVRFSSSLIGLDVKNDTIRAVTVRGGGGEYQIETDTVVLAIGHSARDTFEMLKRSGVKMEQKSFSVGARIEHIQRNINISQYGESHRYLPAADYKMAVHLENGRSVYTFCMCPGGQVVASASEEGGIVTNGMSKFKRDGINSNSAVLVNVVPSDFKNSDPLAGMYFQREIEMKAYKAAGKTYSAPCQTVGEFLGLGACRPDVVPSYMPGVTWTRIDKIFPKYITDSMREGIMMMDKKLNGFADKGAVLTAPETRSSSPVRILRSKDTLQSNIAGLFPCGEGAGYAGGITSAAVDGIKIAEAAVKRR